MEWKVLRYLKFKVYYVLPIPQAEVCPSTFSSDILSFSYRLINKIINTHRLFATTVSQLKICDFSGETFKSFEVL